MKFRSSVNWARILFLAAVTIVSGRNGLEAQETPGQLTVKRIYSQPSLSGRLNRGVQWTPDGQSLSYFATNGQGKQAKSELWLMDAASGQKHVLVDSQKLESVLPAEKKVQSQATGLGRHPASGYLWAPNGAAILFIGPNSLGWLDLKSQATRTLLQ